MIQLKISQKIPLMITISTLLTGILVGSISYLQSQDIIVSDVESKMEALLRSSGHGLGSYLASIQQDLDTLSTNQIAVDAVQEFSAAWDALGSNQETTLQKLYINDNPHPTGQKDNLDAAADDSLYSQLHKQYHIWFRKFLRAKGYYDVFLTDTRGNLVYTVFKELDYATNMNSGKWRDTDLANAYRAAIANPNSMHFFDFRPYGPSHGAPASFIAQAIKDNNGAVVGVLTFQMPIDRLNNTMAVYDGMGASGETYIVGSDYLMRSDSRFSEESTILKTKVDSESVSAALQGKAGIEITSNYNGIEVFSAYEPFEFLGAKWALIAEQEVSEVLEPAEVMRNQILLLTLFAVAIVTGLGMLWAHRITSPLKTLIGLMTKLEAGDTSFSVPHEARQDEIGDMAKALNSFKETAIRNEELNIERENTDQADRQRRREERQKLMNELASEFESTVSDAINKVFDTASGLSQASSAMGEATSNASQKSLQVASTSGETSSNVQTVAGAAEEMTASIREIAKQVTKSKQVIDEAVQRAESADNSAQVLSKAVVSIGEVTDLINDITDKINMLALNATIESARAGEAGKGFAVVANEVKDLANQTSIATKDIAKEIANIQSISTEVIDVMRAIREAISNVNEYSSSIATAVEEQSAATNEISMNMLSAADGVQNISSNIEDVTKAAELADTAANEVLEASKMLTEQARFLDDNSRSFIDGIRKAS